MTAFFFSMSYNPTDFNIIDLKIDGNNLLMKVSMTTYIELIANGYRPEMDISQIKTFIFKSVIGLKTLNKPYTINNIFYDTKLHLVINNCDFVVNNDKIDIE